MADTDLLDLETAPEARSLEPVTPAEAPAVETRQEPTAAPAAATEVAALSIPYPEDEPDEPLTDAPTLAEEIPTTESPTPGDTRYGPSALTKLIGANDSLKSFLESNPRARSQLYQFARRSGELAEYQQVLPSLARVREAAESARQLDQIDHLYLEGKPQDFFLRLWDAQASTDPLTGQRVSSGVYERHVGFLHGLMLEALGHQADQTHDTKLQNAVETVREALGVARTSPAVGDSLSNLPPSIRRRLAEAERAEAELNDLRIRRSQEAEEQREQFKQEIVSETAERLDAFVRGLLGNTGFNEYTQRAVARDFIEQAAELADRDPAHAAAMEEMFERGLGPETRERLVAKALAWARQHAREILEPIARGAAEAARREQSERESARGARLRPEPSGGGRPSDPLRPSVRDLIVRREGALRRRLSDREILDL